MRWAGAESLFSETWSTDRRRVKRQVAVNEGKRNKVVIQKPSWKTGRMLQSQCGEYRVNNQTQITRWRGRKSGKQSGVIYRTCLIKTQYGGTFSTWHEKRGAFSSWEISRFMSYQCSLCEVYAWSLVGHKFFYPIEKKSKRQRPSGMDARPA